MLGASRIPPVLVPVGVSAASPFLHAAKHPTADGGVRVRAGAGRPSAERPQPDRQPRAVAAEPVSPEPDRGGHPDLARSSDDLVSTRVVAGGDLPRSGAAGRAA